jgi:hypothetical protein
MLASKTRPCGRAFPVTTALALETFLVLLLRDSLRAKFLLLPRGGFFERRLFRISSGFVPSPAESKGPRTR